MDKIKIEGSETKTLIEWRKYFDTLIEEYFPYSTATLTFENDEILLDIREVNHYPIRVQLLEPEELLIEDPLGMPGGLKNLKLLSYTVDGKEKEAVS